MVFRYGGHRLPSVPGPLLCFPDAIRLIPALREAGCREYIGMFPCLLDTDLPFPITDLGTAPVIVKFHCLSLDFRPKVKYGQRALRRVYDRCQTL